MTSLSNVFAGGFDAHSVEPAAPRDFALLPVGAYNVEITGAEVKDTKKGDGQYLETELTVADGEHASRKVWARLNLVSPNPEAERIGRSELAALCLAVGIAKIKEAEELFGKTLRVRLGIDPAKGEFPAKNKVTAYEALGAPGSRPTGAPAAAAPAWASRPAPTAPTAPASASSAPWARK